MLRLARRAGSDVGGQEHRHQVIEECLPRVDLEQRRHHHVGRDGEDQARLSCDKRLGYTSSQNSSIICTCLSNYLK